MTKFLKISKIIITILNLIFLIGSIIMSLYVLLNFYMPSLVAILFILIFYFAANIFFLNEKTEVYFYVLNMILGLLTIFSFIPYYFNENADIIILLLPLLIFQSFTTYVVYKSNNALLS